MRLNLEVLEDRTVPSFTLGANAGIILGNPGNPPPVDTWYQDRYRPANFVYGQMGGGRTDVVEESISAADRNGMRPTLSPTAYNIPFYDIQGEKYTFTTAERPSYLAVDLYVPSSWADLNQSYSGGDSRAIGSLASLWGAGVDANGAIVNYPEIGYNNQTGGIAIKDGTVGAWTSVPGFTGSDKWYQIGFDVDGQGNINYFVNGQLVHTSSGTGVVNFSDTFLEGYNAGNSYDIFWDHLRDNTAPVVATGANINPTVNTAFNGTVATFTTADTLGPAQAFQATITWGDGTITTGSVTGGNGTFTVTGGHTYTAGGTFALSVQISSPTTQPGAATGSATVAPPAGTTPGTFLVAAPGGATEGSPFSLTVRVVDAEGNTLTGFTGSVHFLSSDPHAVLPGAFTFASADAGAHTFSGIVLTKAGPQTITVTDGNGSGVSASVSVSVSNVAPAVALPGGDVVLDAGDHLSRDGSFTDPGVGAWVATADYGDGSGPQPLPLGPDHTFHLDHVYAREGTYAVTVQVSDGQGGVGFASFTANVYPAGTDLSLLRVLRAPPGGSTSGGTNGITATLFRSAGAAGDGALLLLPLTTAEAMQSAGPFTFQLAGATGSVTYDVRSLNLGPGDVAVITFDLPSGPAGTEVLEFFNPATHAWEPVRGSTALPGSLVMDLAGGKVTVILDGASNPKVYQLSGTVFTVAITPAPAPVPVNALVPAAAPAAAEGAPAPAAAGAVRATGLATAVFLTTPRVSDGATDTSDPSEAGFLSTLPAVTDAGPLTPSPPTAILSPSQHTLTDPLDEAPQPIPGAGKDLPTPPADGMGGLAPSAPAAPEDLGRGARTSVEGGGARGAGEGAVAAEAMLGAGALILCAGPLAAEAGLEEERRPCRRPPPGACINPLRTRHAARLPSA